MKLARSLTALPMAAAAILVLAAPPQARAAIFACINGIQGDATTQGFEGCIAVVSVGELLEMPLAAGGTGETRSTTTPVYRPFRLIKQLDRSSPVWRDKLLTGTLLTSDLRITFTTNGEAGPLPYFEIMMAGTLVTAVSMTADADGVPIEVISLNPLQVEWTYTPYDSAGTPQSPVTASWDFSLNASF